MMVWLQLWLMLKNDMWEAVFVVLQSELTDLPDSYLRGEMWTETQDRVRMANPVNTEHRKFILHHS